MYKVIKSQKPYNSQLLMTSVMWEEVQKNTPINELIPDLKKSRLRTDRHFVNGKWVTIYEGLIEKLIKKNILNFKPESLYSCSLLTVNGWVGVKESKLGKEIIYLHYENDMYGTVDEIYMIDFIEITSDKIKF